MGKRATREALGDEVLKLGEENKDIYVIDCDVSKSCKTLEFAKRFPDQHINVGISEQNAVGMAAGLATTGKIPFVVTYAIFGSMRAVEQIRQEVCYPNQNVKILCSHGGLTPANDGASHQCIEDMGILRTIPGMNVIMPADYTSARKLIRAASVYQGPVYLRFTRDGIPDIYEDEDHFEIGKAKCLQDGNDISIMANGDTLFIAIEAAKILAEEGISVRLYDFHTIKPLDVEAVKEAVKETGKIITVEDHNILNGLGSAVCEVVAELGQGIVRRVGVQDRFGESAPYEALLEMNGITKENICKIARELLK
ncbi:MAG TPA: transketolase family protein [Candidatus Merdenecus merdavium]|nr:transketolase family protein [Candidatus Merdenecus merdavium]